MINEATDKKAITKQVIIDSKYSARLLPITADEKVIDIIQSALAELSAIKQRAEEKRNDGNTLLREIELIDYILEGEGK